MPVNGRSRHSGSAHKITDSGILSGAWISLKVKRNHELERRDRDRALWGDLGASGDHRPFWAYSTCWHRAKTRLASQLRYRDTKAQRVWLAELSRHKEVHEVRRLVTVLLVAGSTAAATLAAAPSLAAAPAPTPRWILHIQRYPGGISNGVRAMVSRAGDGRTGAPQARRYPGRQRLPGPTSR